MYAAVWLLATITGGAFLHSLADRPRRRTWLIVYAVSNTALLMVSFVGIVPLLVQGPFVATLLARRRPRGRILLEAAMAAVLSVVPLLVWLPLSHRAVTDRKQIDWIAPTSARHLPSELFQLLSSFLLGLEPAAIRPQDAAWSRPVTAVARWMLVGLGSIVVAYFARLVRDARIGSPRNRAITAEPSLLPKHLTRAEVGTYLALWAGLPPLGVVVFSLAAFPLSGIPRYVVASAPDVFLLVASSLSALKPRGLALGIGIALVSVNVGLVVFGKRHTTMVPWHDLVLTSRRVGNALPQSRGDAARLPRTVSLVNRNIDSFDDLERTCIEYEQTRITTEENLHVSLRCESFTAAARRGEPFLIIEHDTAGASTGETRPAITKSIADAAGLGPHTLREIETVTIYQGKTTLILPSPLSRHSFGLWLALPAKKGVGSRSGIPPMPL
jgi:hypothetical protein